MAGIPLTSGSVGSFTAGNLSPFTEAAVGLAQSGDIARQKQLEKLLQQSQAYDATKAQRQDIGQEVTNDPSLAQNHQLMRQLQDLYRGTGMSAPITPGSPALSTPEVRDPNAPGGSLPGLNRPASGGINAQALTGGNFATELSKNITTLQQIQPQMRAQFFKAQGIQVSPAQEQLLQGLALPPAEAERKDKAIEDDFSKQFNNYLKLGNAGSAMASVKSAMARAQAAGWNPQRINDTFGPYMEQGVSELSPLQVARLARDQSLNAKDVAQGGKATAEANQINTLLAPKVQEIKANTALRLQQAKHLQDLSDNMKALLGPKMGQLNAITKLELGNAANAMVKGDLIGQEADYYNGRTQQIMATKGTDPREWVAATNAASQAMNNSQTVLSSLIGARSRYESSLTAADPVARANAAPMIKQLDNQILQEQNRYNAFATQFQSLQSVGAFSAGGTGIPQQGSDPVSGAAAIQQPQQSAGPTPQATGTGKMVTRQALTAIARQKFGGDVVKAEAQARALGYTIAP